MSTTLSPPAKRKLENPSQPVTAVKRSKNEEGVQEIKALATDDTKQPPMSKTALKKAKRKAEYLAGRGERRKAEKLRRKANKAKRKLEREQNPAAAREHDDRKNGLHHMNPKKRRERAENLMKDPLHPHVNDYFFIYIYSLFSGIEFKQMFIICVLLIVYLGGC